MQETMISGFKKYVSEWEDYEAHNYNLIFIAVILEVLIYISEIIAELGISTYYICCIQTPEGTI